MHYSNRVVVALLIATAAVGCKKPKSTDTGANTAAPAPPPPPAATVATPAPKPEKPAKPDKPASDKPEPPTTADSGYRWEMEKVTNTKFEVPSNRITSLNANVLTVKTPTPGAGVEFLATEGRLSAKVDERGLVEGGGQTPAERQGHREVENG